MLEYEAQHFTRNVISWCPSHVWHLREDLWKQSFSLGYHSDLNLTTMISRGKKNTIKNPAMNQIVTENLTKVQPQRGSPQSQGWAVEQQFQRINAARWILTERLTLISDTDNCPEVEVLLWPHSLHMLHMELSCRAALRALWKMCSGGVFSDEVPNTSTLYSQRNAYICQYSHEHHHTAVNV